MEVTTKINLMIASEGIDTLSKTLKIPKEMIVYPDDKIRKKLLQHYERKYRRKLVKMTKDTYSYCPDGGNNLIIRKETVIRIVTVETKLDTHIYTTFYGDRRVPLRSINDLMAIQRFHRLHPLKHDEVFSNIRKHIEKNLKAYEERPVGLRLICELTDTKGKKYLVTQEDIMFNSRPIESILYNLLDYSHTFVSDFYGLITPFLYPSSPRCEFAELVFTYHFIYYI